MSTQDEEQVALKNASNFIPKENWSDRQKFALACRILAHEKHDSGLAGQVSVLIAPGRYLTGALGFGFDEITVGTTLHVDDKLNVLDSGWTPSAAIRFHSHIFRARPDVRCIVHTHPPFTNALSISGQRLVAAHMDTTPMFEDCAYLEEWPGLPIGESEGEIIAGALGSSRSILLANHGLLTAGKSIEEATYLAVFMERAAQMQLQAAALGEIHRLKPEHARAAHDFLLSDPIVVGTFNSWARKMVRLDPTCLEE